MTRLKPRESDIQATIMDYLAAEQIWAVRFNTGSLMGKAGYPVKFHSAGKGFPDILATPFVDVGLCGDGYRAPAVLWIEVKAPGKKQSPEQAGFQHHVVHTHNHHYICVQSVDEVIAWIKNHP